MSSFSSLPRYFQICSDMSQICLDNFRFTPLSPMPTEMCGVRKIDSAPYSDTTTKTPKPAPIRLTFKFLTPNPALCSSLPSFYIHFIITRDGHEAGSKGIQDLATFTDPKSDLNAWEIWILIRYEWYGVIECMQKHGGDGHSTGSGAGFGVKNLEANRIRSLSLRIRFLSQFF